MLRALKAFAIMIVVAVGLVYLFGLRAGPEVNASLTSQFTYTDTYLFDLVTDIEKYPERKKDLQSLEILEREGTSVTRWKEHYNFNDWKEYQLVEKITPTYFAYEIVNSSDGHTAMITYTFETNNKFTSIMTTEVGQVRNLFDRGLRVLIEDESYLKSEIKWLRVAIQTEFLARP